MRQWWADRRQANRDAEAQRAEEMKRLACNVYGSEAHARLVHAMKRVETLAIDRRDAELYRDGIDRLILSALAVRKSLRKVKKQKTKWL